jgi:hypothetical protein
MTLAVSTVAELAPLVRRAVSLDPATLVRVRVARSLASALLRLPFDVLAGRTVRIRPAEPVPAAEPVPPAEEQPAKDDSTYRAAELLAWLDGDGPTPVRRDAEWRGGVPPVLGWLRVETVPDDVVRSLVRSGALALKEAAAREGVPDAQPRAEVADALLDSIVLTVTGDGHEVQINLRLLSALTRLGFLPAGSQINVDVAGRWIRIAAEYGSVYAERPGSQLGVLRL